MRIRRADIPNVLSLSRVPAALAFVVLYNSDNKTLFVPAIAIAFLALATDFLDGFLARRWHVVSQDGYFLDGIGDKAFHIAILLVIEREQFAPDALIWVLVVREVLLYALRVIDRQPWRQIASLRQLSRYHALFIRLYFGCFFIADGIHVFGLRFVPQLAYSNILAWIAAAIGYVAIICLINAIAVQD